MVTKGIIHVGLHKTGTTSIQEHMVKNVTWLRDQFGIDFPCIPGLRAPVCHRHFPLAYLDYENVPKGKQHAIGRGFSAEDFLFWRENIGKLIARRSNLEHLADVYSDEFISTMQQGRLRDLSSVLRATYPTLAVVMFIRRHDEQYLSLNLERTKRGIPPSSLPSPNNFTSSSHKIVRKFRKIFGTELQLAPVSSSMDSTDLFLNMIKSLVRLDGDLGELPYRPLRKNLSLSAEKTLLLECLNRVQPRWGVSSRWKPGLQESKSWRSGLKRIKDLDSNVVGGSTPLELTPHSRSEILVRHLKADQDLGLLWDLSARQPESSSLVRAQWFRTTPRNFAEVALQSLPKVRRAEFRKLLHKDSATELEAFLRNGI